jgi:uncharacterized C2H2 Zn-finger protein
MARVNVLLAAFHRITKQREALKSIEQRLADRERPLMEDIGRALAGVGYRLTRLNGVMATAPARGKRKPRVRQDLKCPKCERRFFFAMHVARHLNTIHGRKQRNTHKAKAA